MQKLGLIVLVLLPIATHCITQQTVQYKVIQKLQHEYSVARRGAKAIKKLLKYRNLLSQDKQDLSAMGKRSAIIALLLIAPGVVLIYKWQKDLAGILLKPTEHQGAQQLAAAGQELIKKGMPQLKSMAAKTQEKDTALAWANSHQEVIEDPELQALKGQLDVKCLTTVLNEEY